MGKSELTAFLFLCPMGIFFLWGTTSFLTFLQFATKSLALVCSPLIFRKYLGSRAVLFFHTCFFFLINWFFASTEDSAFLSRPPLPFFFYYPYLDLLRSPPSMTNYPSFAYRFSLVMSVPRLSVRVLSLFRSSFFAHEGRFSFGALFPLLDSVPVFPLLVGFFLPGSFLIF